MKRTAISQFGLQLTRFGLVNCYLVREPDGFTLIDGGVLAGSAGPILDAARAAGAPIRRILLTHAHVDHVGAVDALVGELGPGVEVACGARSLPLLRRPPDMTPQPGEAEGRIRGGLPGIVTRPGRLLGDGDRCGSLLCIETPGHIPGHLSFLDERDGTLYAGDALIGVGRLAVSGFAPWYFFFPNGATWNASVAVASAERLLAFQVARFACGHGAVRDGGPDLLRAALARARS